MLGAGSVANAGYWLPKGIYVPTCGWHFNGFAWIYRLRLSAMLERPTFGFTGR
jgi:hypothetical protein